MTKQEYQQYLRSEHWFRLRARKLKNAKRNAIKSGYSGLRCVICGVTENLEVHHMFYGELYDVRTSHLRVLCRNCHQTTHDLIKDKKLWILKRKRGGTGNMFNLMKSLVLEVRFGEITV